MGAFCLPEVSAPEARLLRRGLDTLRKCLRKLGNCQPRVLRVQREERMRRTQGGRKHSTDSPAEMEMRAARGLVRLCRWWVLIWNNGMKPQAKETGRVNRQILPTPSRLINMSRYFEPKV